MYNERIVKKPRKTYTCDMCTCTIDGKHIYVAQVWEGVFHTGRRHIECSEFFRSSVCVDCYECVGLTPECFTVSECDNCDKRYPDEGENCAITIYECIKEKLAKEALSDTNNTDEASP